MHSSVLVPFTTLPLTSEYAWVNAGFISADTLQLSVGNMHLT